MVDEVQTTTITPAPPSPPLDPFFVAPAKPAQFGATPTTQSPEGRATSSTAETKPVDQPPKLVHGFLPPDAKKPKAPVEDPPDTKEQHFEAIRYLIDQLKTTTDAPTKATLENISTRLDEIEDKKTEKTVKW